MANKNLTDLTARTATADSDLLHINSGGADYKETKQDFLMGTFYREFANTSAVTSQIDALPAQGTWFGRIAGYGKQTETGLPINANGNLQVRKYNANYVEADFFPVSATADEQYRITKVNGTWGSWSKIPQRSEITSLNNSLANSLVKNPSNIASYNEFDALATSGGFYAFRLSASFSIGGVALPNYGRGLIMNYSSSDSSFIYVSPDGFWYGFKNSGTWYVKRASTF